MPFDPKSAKKKQGKNLNEVLLKTKDLPLKKNEITFYLKS